MPKVLSRQPHWLDRGRPGFDLFLASDKAKQLPDNYRDGPLKRIAHRGSEVFVAVGNELRWSDLAVLKDGGDLEGQTHSVLQGSTQLFRVLRTPVSRPIRQLSISPSGDFVAISTSHTCHVCVLPARERLNFHDNAPIPLKYFQVGPTAHVMEESPLVSAIWHPLSPTGNDLVTITKAACARLWELDRKNRSTFDEPALAVDLKKLGNASSVREDLSASKYGSSKGFSPDEAEMEVASGCFGGRGEDDEDGWSSMTLWVAMTEGDVYALCPFLPSRFAAPPTMLPALSTSVVARSRILNQDRQVPELERLVAEQQSHWLAAVDEQDPILVQSDTAVMEIYSRPNRPGAIPRLQGPFRVTPEPDFGEITDIHVIAPKINDEALFEGDDWDEFQTDEGLSIGIVCLATTTHQIHVCLNVEGVEAQWLPSRRTMTQFMGDGPEEHELLLLEMIDVARTHGNGRYNGWPTFTASPTDRYELFFTQPTGIYSVSVKPWVDSLEGELSASQPDSTGIGLRTGVILESTKSIVEMLTSELSEAQQEISASIAILDPIQSDLGYLVMTSVPNALLAVILDVPSTAAHPFEPENSNAPLSLPASEPRAPYQPAEAFFQPSGLPAHMKAWREESGTSTGGDLKGQIKFTPYTLQKVTEAHRVLSSETHNLGLATADLFRRCERMLSELQGQVQKVKELSNRIDSVTGDDPFPDRVDGEPEPVRGGQHIEDRIRASRDKAVEIKDRVEVLRRKVRGAGGKDLSAREKAFAAEIAQLERSLVERSTPDQSFQMVNSELTASTDSDRSAVSASDDSQTIAGRFKAVEDVYRQLKNQAEEAQKQLESHESVEEDRPASLTSGGPLADFRRQKLVQVMALLERETALVEAVSERLERLQMGAK